MRLKPIPEQTALVACAVADTQAAEKLLAAIVNSKTTPTTIELIAGPDWQADPALADLGGLSKSGLYLVVGR